MTQIQKRVRNLAAYRKSKADLVRAYPPGRFVAMYAGRVVADAATFDGVLTALAAASLDAVECLVVEVGTDYPEKAVIFAGFGS